MSPVVLGFLASFAAGSATTLGAGPAIVLRRVSPKLQDIFMGFGAGVMIAASVFSLIIPSLEHAGGGLNAIFIASGGIITGGVFLFLANRFFPHEHFIKGPEGSSLPRLKKIWLFVLAITIHNLPEGLSVGVGFGGEDLKTATALAIGIGLQNIPEGMVVALALKSEGYSRWFAVVVTALTGLVEPVGGILGASAVTIFSQVLPFGLAFAAGAMLFVVSNEIIPESHRKGFEMEATFGVLFGFVVMMALD
ncbi:MAG: ZIP family metal transporter, partial [Nitrospirae bacterium]